jgi:hypothetical protein
VVEGAAVSAQHELPGLLPPPDAAAGRIARFPAQSIRAIPLAPLRCAGCGAGECVIFVCGEPIAAFCGPRCAAASDVWLWRDATPDVRARWSDPVREERRP